MSDKWVRQMEMCLKYEETDEPVAVIELVTIKTYLVRRPAGVKDRAWRFVPGNETLLNEHSYTRRLTDGIALSRTVKKCTGVVQPENPNDDYALAVPSEDEKNDSDEGDEREEYA